MTGRILKSMVVMLLLAAGLAQGAPLVGTSVNGKLGNSVGDVLNLDRTVIDPGVEFTYENQIGNGATFTADISDTTISFGYYTGNASTLGNDLFWTLTFDPSVMISSITESSDNFVNGMSLVSLVGSTAVFEIKNFSHGSNLTYAAVYDVNAGNAVPAPPTLALLGLGLAGLGIARRRKAQ